MSSSFQMKSLIILISIFEVLNAFGTQSAGVRGTLMCGDVPLKNTKVKLYDDDSGPDLDDLLAEGTTDSLGQFLLYGSTSELTTIDPKINIYHDCLDEIMPCQRKVTIRIPQSYVSDQSEPSRYFDLGTLNMEGTFDGESRDCLHR